MLLSTLFFFQENDLDSGDGGGQSLFDIISSGGPLGMLIMCILLVLINYCVVYFYRKNADDQKSRSNR